MAWGISLNQSSSFRTEELDHCLILVYNTSDTPTVTRPFHFIQAWTTDSSHVDVVHVAWNKDRNSGMEFHKINKRIINTTKALKKWNRESFGFTHMKIREMEEEVEMLQISSSIDENR